MKIPPIRSSLLLVAFMLLRYVPRSTAAAVNAGSLAIASQRNDYDDTTILPPLQQLLVENNDDIFLFGRFQSPDAVRKALRQGYHRQRRRKTSSSSLPPKFTYFQAKDGRHGNVSSTKLGGDWVLAESEQLAVNCTTHEVLLAYLSGKLQKQWNQDTVLECRITEKNNNGASSSSSPVAFWRGKQQPNQQDLPQKGEAYYQQDLVLRSQRIIRQKTGIMRYSQRIMIDQIGSDRYCVSVRLDPSTQNTALKPFESLSVYVHLLPEQENVRIYAAGIMKVNRKVVPNLVVFDASGIAGSMAGKGTLWLAAYFQKQSELFDNTGVRSPPSHALLSK